jgi:cytoskeletal protein RodZ
MTMIGTLSQLARKRQDQGVSLAEIARETKINPRYLEAIEEGRLQDVPGGIYLRSYLQQYAGCVDPHAAGQLQEALRGLSAGY